MTESANLANRKLLLLDNTWKTLDDGMDSVNRSIALEFKKYKNVEIFCTILLHKDNELSSEDLEDAKSNEVTLVYSENYQASFPDYNFMTEAFNQDPFPFIPSVWKGIQGITHIVAHWPYTANAGFIIRDIVYPDAKVILVLHVIPDDLLWMEEDLPFNFSQDDMLQAAETADYVFSFTQKVFNNFTAIFRNHASKRINHKLLIPEGHNELFGLKQKTLDPNDVPTILCLTYGNEGYKHEGLDIAACAINKTAELLQNTRPFAVRLVIGVYGEIASTTALKKMVKTYIKNSFVMVEYHHYDNLKHLMTDLESCALVLFPTRCEPFGSPLIHVLSAGVPTLMSKNCGVSTRLRKLVSYASDFLVPVSNNETAVKQDASIWRERIIQTLADIDTARENALHLQRTLRRDEGSKATLDSITALVLGGISLQVQVLALENDDESKSNLSSRLDVEGKLFQIFRHCVRLKHHPLVVEEDLQEILPETYESIPATEILDNVIDQIEEFGRRVVNFDEKNKKLTIFCPTPEALKDLWSNCDVINRALERILKDDYSFLEIFEAKSLKTRFYISGPELLKYKRAILGKSDLDDEDSDSDEEDQWFWNKLRLSINAIHNIKNP